jgi:hypothetical protein
MYKLLIGILVLVVLAGSCGVGTYKVGVRNVNWVKDHATAGAHQLGFEIVGYEGYQVAPILGGMVWYTMKRNPDNGIIYEGGFSKWGNEVHIYNTKAIDAIKP